MAVVAPQDWQLPTRDTTMDLQNSSRQRSSPANDHSSPASSPQNLQNLQQQQLFMAQQQQQQQQQQGGPQSPYTFPAQQQAQGSWTPSINATPFYPSFYQPQLVQGTPQFSPAAQIPAQAPFFDPTNAQLQAWTYQQMVMHGYPGLTPQQQLSLMQRPGGGHISPNEYFAAHQIPSPFNNFPSGTPPPHARGGAGDQSNQYPPGYHPYRRPNRQQSQSGSDSGSDRRPQPPYIRSDASGSTSSVNSTGSRQRTNSNQSGHSGTGSPATGSGSRSRSNTASSATSNSARNSPSPAQSSSPSPSPLRNNVHGRTPSTSSTSSTATATTTRPSGSSSSSSTPATSTTPTANTSKAPSNPSPAPRVPRPSPLSQGNLTAEKRMSRDDSDLAAMLSPPQDATSSRSIKSRLRRALSFNPSTSLKETLKEEEAERDDDASIKASAINGATSTKWKNSKSPAIAGSSKPSSGSQALVDDGASTATVQTKKKGRAASLFNARFNASTDNISLSSTVSSASVMIRKLGSLGNLARRNSLAGITSLFKDKDKDKDKDGDKDKKGKKKDKKSAKAEASEASVSHVTAELDRSGDWSASPELNGLTPAAKLARQHTLKSNAEAAAKAKAEKEAAARGAAGPSNGPNGAAPPSGVPTWDKNTATRNGLQTHVQPGPGVHITEDGSRVLVEDDEEESDDGHYASSQGPQNYSNDGWDDDDWDAEVDQEEDVTIRAELQRASLGDAPEVEPWAVDVRRSVERARVPKKGILKHAGTYSQANYGPNAAQSQTRTRSNSYNAPGTQSELGPLARIPSPDPDHIDGLHRHGHPSHPDSATDNVAAPSLPPLSFESGSPLGANFSSSPKEQSEPAAAQSQQEAGNRSSIFQNPSFNSSAPVLSNMGRASPVPLPRSAVVEKKRLTFATSLAVYDTFASSVYDRRSEPATWSRLTPQLAQRIKEELNSYKMEEMEVHAASRIHTQFFV